MLRRLIAFIKTTDLHAAFAEYTWRVRQHTWELLVSGVGAILGLIELAVPKTAPRHGGPAESFIPLWLWLSLLVGGLTVAQFRVFVGVRRERNEARQEIIGRFDSIRYRFQMQALRGGVAEQIDPATGQATAGYRFWFEFLNGGVEALDYDVEQMAITLGSHTAPANIEFASSSGLIILPGRAMDFYYPFIPAPTNPPLMGTGEYSVLYGHPSGGKRFRTRHKFHIGWVMTQDQHGNPMGQEPSWVTMGRITHEPVA